MFITDLSVFNYVSFLQLNSEMFIQLILLCYRQGLHRINFQFPHTIKNVTCTQKFIVHRQVVDDRFFNLQHASTTGLIVISQYFLFFIPKWKQVIIQPLKNERTADMAVPPSERLAETHPSPCVQPWTNS